jgi:hypothetical protein
MPASDVKINLTRSANELAPKGIYLGKIEDVEVVEDSPSGFPYLKLRLGANIGGERKAFWTNVSLSPTARFKVDELLDAVEAPAEGELSIAQLKGAQVYFTLEITSYNGTQRNSVEKFLAPKTVKPEQVLNVSAAQAASARRMSSPTAASTAARPARRQARPAEMGTGDDDPESATDDSLS